MRSKPRRKALDYFGFVSAVHRLAVAFAPPESEGDFSYDEPGKLVSVLKRRLTGGS